MSLESFTGFDAGEGMSEAAFEAFKERMQAAAAQIAAIKKEEGKQKKKEEELHKILLKFIQHSGKKELTLLIARALEQNIPANFILAIILLGNEDIQREVGNLLMLAGGVEESVENSKALIFFDEEDQSIPLRLKLEMDKWIKNMLSQGEECAHKLIKTAYDIEMVEIESESSFGDSSYEETKNLKPIFTKLMAFVLRDYLEQHKVEESYEKLSDFSHFIISGIITKVQEILENTKLLN